MTTSIWLASVALTSRALTTYRSLFLPTFE